eukprot:3918206-Amphidinium_carterae.1
MPSTTDSLDFSTEPSLNMCGAQNWSNSALPHKVIFRASLNDWSENFSTATHVTCESAHVCMCEAPLDRCIPQAQLCHD